MKNLLTIAISAVLSIIMIPNFGECDQFVGRTGYGLPPNSGLGGSLPGDIELDPFPTNGGRTVLPPTSDSNSGNSSSSENSNNSTSVNIPPGDGDRLAGEAGQVSITDFIPDKIIGSEDPIKDAKDRVNEINSSKDSFARITRTGTENKDGMEYEYADVEGWKGEADSTRAKRIHERYRRLKENSNNSSGSSRTPWEESNDPPVDGTYPNDSNLPEAKNDYEIPDPEEASPEILDGIKDLFDEEQWQQEMWDSLKEQEAEIENSLSGLRDQQSIDEALGNLDDDIGKQHAAQQEWLDGIRDTLASDVNKSNSLAAQFKLAGMRYSISIATAYYKQAMAIEASVNQTGVEAAELEKELLEEIERQRKEREKANDAIDSMNKNDLPWNSQKQGEIQQKIANLLQDLLEARDSTDEDKKNNEQQNDDIREDHNEAARDIADNSFVAKVEKNQQIDIDVAKETARIFTPYGSRLPPSHPQYNNVLDTRLYIDQARTNVQNDTNGEYRQQRLDLLDSADVTTDIAEQQFVDGDNEAGSAILDVAKTVADIATDFLPYVSTAKDLYAGFTGKNFITGEKLAGWERGVSIASAVVDLATLGVGGKAVKAAGKGASWLLGKFADGAKRLSNLKIEPSWPHAADIFDALESSDEVAAAIRGIDDVAEAGEAVGKNTGELVEELNNLGLKKGDADDVIAEAKAIIDDPAWVKTSSQGRTVYKNDSLISSGRPEVLDDGVPESIKRRVMSGETNLDLMKSGNAPIGPDGRQINLHHLSGQEPGTMVEISASDHPDIFETMHSLIEKSFRNDEALRDSYEGFKFNYWIERAKDFFE